MLLLRRLDGGMAGFRRSKEWSHYRSLDTWSQVLISDMITLIYQT